ncbi:type IV pilin-like G/H family protein [Hydrocoleum sp. CS-953]|uniref:type IV pilin-like G/H family protein n=1 Tax=Hydrocoleum sp. CS-953 TaxID=1671698 RepID=UPI000B9C7433|nr:type IV pilin-like G/H family protein [Hydrocoleum sp. CS-953]
MSTKQSANFRNISLANFIGLIFVVVVFSIVLPSFFNPSYPLSKRSEAKQYISSINKGQQAYYAENGEFNDNISDLGLGIKLETVNYSYKIKEINSMRVLVTATAKKRSFYYEPMRLPFFGIRLPFYRRIRLSENYLKSYSGIVYIKDGTSSSMICETDEPSLTAPDNFQSFDQCPLGSSETF